MSRQYEDRRIDGYIEREGQDLNAREKQNAVEIGKVIYTGNITLGEAGQKAIEIVKQQRGMR